RFRRPDVLAVAVQDRHPVGHGHPGEGGLLFRLVCHALLLVWRVLPWQQRRVSAQPLTRRLEGRLGPITRRLEGRLGPITRRLEGRLGATPGKGYAFCLRSLRARA